MSEYAERDPRELDRQGGHFSRHMLAMTSENLYSKGDIAMELAHRDMVIDRLTRERNEARAERESLRKVCILFQDERDELLSLLRQALTWWRNTVWLEALPETPTYQSPPGWVLAARKVLENRYE